VGPQFCGQIKHERQINRMRVRQKVMCSVEEHLALPAVFLAFRCLALGLLGEPQLASRR
jgi:hypothetical protein